MEYLETVTGQKGTDASSSHPEESKLQPESASKTSFSPSSYFQSWTSTPQYSPNPRNSNPRDSNSHSLNPHSPNDPVLERSPTGISKNSPYSTGLEPSVQIRNLNFHYGEGDLFKQVLFDINLNIYPGQIVILTGPSGSGKTTLLTLIGALRTIQDDNLQVLGQELKGLNPKKLVQIRKNIGFIFQAHNLFYSLTARQNVIMSTDLFAHEGGMRWHPKKRKRF